MCQPSRRQRRSRGKWSVVEAASLTDPAAFSGLLTRYSGSPDRLGGGICEVQEDQPGGGPAGVRVQEPDLWAPARFGIDRGDSAERRFALVDMQGVRKSLVPVSAAHRARAEVPTSLATYAAAKVKIL